MITIEIWQEFVIDKIKRPYIDGELNIWDIYVTVFMSIVSLPVDIILFPVELITFIIYKFLNNKK